MMHHRILRYPDLSMRIAENIIASQRRVYPVWPCRNAFLLEIQACTIFAFRCQTRLIFATHR